MDCDELVISLLFPPSDYVSGINAFKRILNNKKPVDILQAKSEIVNTNFDVFNRYINDRLFLDVDLEFDTPSSIFKSLSDAREVLQKDYAKIYSRSWLANNHFIALDYKLSKPDVYWCAEFSDPLILNIINRVRNKKGFFISNPSYVDYVNGHILELNEKNNVEFPLIEDGASVFFLAEYLTYLFADEIIFTNENQRNAMLNQFSSDVREFVLKKSIIEMHPTLDEEFYHIESVELDLDDDYINMAYFGKDYYGIRHFESLFYSIESLNHKFKDKIRIYLFMEEVSLIKRLVSSFNSRDSFIVKKPLDYFEFLNATTKFDVLIVNDVITKGLWSANPFLPSKISDYLGSSRDIWAFYEKGSTLSKFNLKYMSDMADFGECRNQLINILEDYGFKDDNYSFNEDYFIQRLTTLNRLFDTEFKRNSRLIAENKSLKKLNSDILSSNSWKLTRPLRDIRNKK